MPATVEKQSSNHWTTRELSSPEMEHYSVIKKTEIMPFAATWMDLEITILSDVCQTETINVGYHLHMESTNKIL